MHDNNQPTPAPAHPAATVILLRPAPIGFEVLLLLRNQAIKFAGNNWVFPGGRIDEIDYRGNRRDEKAAAKVAAARESMEEASLNLAPEDFHFFAHWTTPVVEKKRFATWFLLGELHQHQEVKIDQSEIVDYRWLNPQTALQQHRNGELTMFPPTYLSLLELSDFDSTDQVIKALEDRPVPRFAPNYVLHDKQPIVILEGDAAYHCGDLTAEGPRHRLTLTNSGWELTQK